MYPLLSTITPEPRLRSALGPVSGRPSKKWKKKSSLGSSSSPERCRLDLRSITWVVAMLTTAGSTRLTMAEKLLEEGIGSGRASGVAEEPANENDRMAETFPETTVPIRMPTERVAAISPAATYVRRLVQFTLGFVNCFIQSCSYLCPWPSPPAKSITPWKARRFYLP